MELVWANHEQYTRYGKHNMKFDHTKYDAEQFTYDLKGLGELIGMSDEWVLEHFKEAFLQKLGTQLLEVLVLLFKSQLLHMAEIMLVQMIQTEQSQWRGSFANRRNKNYRGFQSGRETSVCPEL